MNTPHLTKENAIKIASEALKSRSLAYDTDKGFWPVFQGLEETRTGDMRPIWSVAFVTPAKQVSFRGKLVEVPEESLFACIDDETEELLYIIHSTGYIE